MPSGGHHRYSDNIRDTMNAQLEAGIPAIKIAWFNRVSTSYVSQLNVKRRKILLNPDAERNKRNRRRGPLVKISAEAHRAMVALVDEVPDCTLGRVVELLRDRFALVVSASTVSRALKRLRVERERQGERERECEGERGLQGAGVVVDEEHREDDDDEDDDEEDDQDARLRAEVGALVAAGSMVNQLVPVHVSPAPIPPPTRRTRATTKTTRKDEPAVVTSGGST